MGLRAESSRSCWNSSMAIYGLCAVGASPTVDGVWAAAHRGPSKEWWMRGPR